MSNWSGLIPSIAFCALRASLSNLPVEHNDHCSLDVLFSCSFKRNATSILCRMLASSPLFPYVHENYFVSLRSENVREGRNGECYVRRTIRILLRPRKKECIARIGVGTRRPVVCGHLITAKQSASEGNRGDEHQRTECWTRSSGTNSSTLG